ncbi:MAG: LuxR C-terminal-related transcriptional regulator [Planctomycetota bacterium]
MRANKLTPREADVAQAQFKLLCPEAIADELALRTNTVKTHKKSYYQKLDVSNGAEFTHWCASKLHLHRNGH